jgi:putative ABC transport system ATP-binding protein
VADQLCKSYKTPAGPVEVLRDSCFSIDRGERVAVLGVSGTGKSTLLNLLGGIDRLTQGSLEVDGIQLERLSDGELTTYRRTQVGFIFQFYNLLPSLTVLENVLSALEARGRLTRSDEQMARDLLVDVGLGAKFHRFPQQLSGGEQQRVAIVRALVKSPPLILADEPTGNLDPETGGRVLDLLLAQTEATGATLVLVTHDAASAARSDRVMVFERGQLVENRAGVE